MAWQSAKKRCFNPKNDRYSEYGGRGIRMSAPWFGDFAQFLADMGECPPGLTLERIDINGHYERGNCCWATPREQYRNRRDNHLIEYDGVKVTLAEAAERTGIAASTIRKRLKLGWSDARAVIP